MNDLVDFLTSKEIMVVYIIVITIAMICLTIYLIKKNNYKRKRKQNTKELKRLVEEIDNHVDEKQIEIEKIDNTEPEIDTILYVSDKIEEKPIETISSIDQTNTQVKIEDKKPIENIEPIKTIQENIHNDIKELENESKYEPQIEIQPIIENIDDDKMNNVENLVLDNMPNVVENDEEELQYTTLEPNKEQAQQELKRLTEELQKAQNEENQVTLSTLEEEQEKNAIISLDELMAKSKEINYDNTVEKYEEDDENKPISIEELERLHNEMKKVEESKAKEEKIEIITTIPENNDTKERIIHQEKLVLDEFNNIKIDEKEPYKVEKKFKSSPVISPVYGIERKEIPESNNMELENTANFEKLDEELKKTNEFLMTLKELQKNLQ